MERGAWRAVVHGVAKESHMTLCIRVSLVVQLVKNLPAMQETWVRKIPWRKKWQSTPVCLPGESHGQSSLAGCSPWGHKELDMTEQLTTPTRK